LFRVLYTIVRQIPAWKLRKQLTKANISSSALKIQYRIHGGDRTSVSNQVGLQTALVRGPGPVSNSINLVKIPTPIGYLKISGLYRRQCSFHLRDSESLISSQFAHLDRRAYYEATSASPTNSYVVPTSSYPVAGTTPVTRTIPSQAIGRSSSPQPSPKSTTHSYPRQSSIGNVQVFKSPSISSTSPTPSDVSTSFRIPMRRDVGTELKLDTYHGEVGGELSPDGRGDPSTSTRAPLATRYSSSFSQRMPSRGGSRSSSRRRFSSTSRHEDDSASDRASAASASVEDDVGDFVKMLDARKPLKSFGGGRADDPRPAVESHNVNIPSAISFVADILGCAQQIPKDERLPPGLDRICVDISSFSQGFYRIIYSHCWLCPRYDIGDGIFVLFIAREAIVTSHPGHSITSF
jgi:hypothetical protein